MSGAWRLVAYFEYVLKVPVALKGNYTRYPKIKAAQYYRLATLMEPDWIPAMVAQIKRQKWFRWHDAGDIQSAKHLVTIRLKLYEGSQIIELAACGLELEACCLSLVAWDFFSQLGA